METFFKISLIRLRLVFVLSLSTAIVTTVSAQDDLLALDNVTSEKQEIKDAFNGSYLINSQTTNVVEGGRLDFLIQHRFGELSEGAFNAFGLDYAAVRFGFDYGISQKFTTGIGRSSVGKNFDGFLKYKLLTQTIGGSKNVPVSMVLFTSAAISAVELKRQNKVHEKNQFSNQLVYTTQLLVSKQFSSRLAIQAGSAFIHRNTVSSNEKGHDKIAMSLGGRIGLSERIHLLADYSYLFNKDLNSYNPLGLGIDIVTGGHIFQIYVTNAVGMIEKEFLTRTLGNIEEGNIRIGFTVSRAFMLKSKVEGGSIK